MKAGMNRRQLLKTASMLAGAAYVGFPDCVYGFQQVSARSNRSADGKIQLNSNENPFGPSEKARKAMAKAADIGHQYPRVPLTALTEAIARHEKLDTDHVLIGAGSYEILSLVAVARLRGGGNVVAPDPTFWAIMNYARQFGAGWRRAPVDDNYKVDTAAMERMVDAETRVVYYCNPNNPTGTMISNELLGEFCATAGKRALVLADEAYLDFVEPDGVRSLAPLVEKNKSLIVTKTFSKIYGLAGMRVGYALAHPDIIRELRMLQTGQGVGVSAVSAAAALASYRDSEFMAQSLKGIVDARMKLTDYFKSAGIEFIPSVTNFMCFDPGRFGDGIVYQLERRNVLVRGFVFDNRPWCRVSITNTDDIAFFIAAHSDLVANG